MSQALRVLSKPYEIFDLADGQSMTLKVTTYERGSMEIAPKYLPPGTTKVIEALRIQLAPGVKAYPPQYYDVTSGTLIAQLLPYFMERGFTNYAYKVTKYGVAPKARFTVDRLPL